MTMTDKTDNKEEKKEANTSGLTDYLLMYDGKRDAVSLKDPKDKSTVPQPRIYPKGVWVTVPETFYTYVWRHHRREFKFSTKPRVVEEDAISLLQKKVESLEKRLDKIEKVIVVAKKKKAESKE
jgi:hypothetical protein